MSESALLGFSMSSLSLLKEPQFNSDLMLIGKNLQFTMDKEMSKFRFFTIFLKNILTKALLNIISREETLNRVLTIK